MLLWVSRTTTVQGGCRIGMLEKRYAGLWTGNPRDKTAKVKKVESRRWLRAWNLMSKRRGVQRNSRYPKNEPWLLPLLQGLDSGGTVGIGNTDMRKGDGVKRTRGRARGATKKERDLGRGKVVMGMEKWFWKKKIQGLFGRRGGQRLFEPGQVGEAIGSFPRACSRHNKQGPKKPNERQSGGRLHRH